MSLIPFPDVPALPGVPAIPRSLLNVAAGVAAVASAFIPASLFGVQWALLDSNGNPVLQPDSFVNFEYKEEHKIPNYPIEQGSFQSYNKVALPFDCRVVVSCGGNGMMSKEEFLNAIESLISSLTLVQIVTPNKTYQNCNLIHVDYRRESTRGVSLILAQLWFQEVRIAQQTVPPTAEPSGTSTINNGAVSPVPPSPTLDITNIEWQ